jgi:hypothetical protein
VFAFDAGEIARVGRVRYRRCCRIGQQVRVLLDGFGETGAAGDRRDRERAECGCAALECGAPS